MWINNCNGYRGGMDFRGGMDAIELKPRLYEIDGAGRHWEEWMRESRHEERLTWDEPKKPMFCTTPNINRQRRIFQRRFTGLRFKLGASRR